MRGATGREGGIIRIPHARRLLALAEGACGRDVEREGAAPIERRDEHADGIRGRGAHALGRRREGRFSSGRTFATTGVMCSAMVDPWWNVGAAITWAWGMCRRCTTNDRTPAHAAYPGEYVSACWYYLVCLSYTPIRSICPNHHRGKLFMRDDVGSGCAGEAPYRMPPRSPGRRRGFAAPPCVRAARGEPVPLGRAGR